SSHVARRSGVRGRMQLPWPSEQRATPSQPSAGSLAWSILRGSDSNGRKVAAEKKLRVRPEGVQSAQVHAHPSRKDALPSPWALSSSRRNLPRDRQRSPPATARQEDHP